MLEEIGLSEKRCLLLVDTTDIMSGNVAWMDLRRGHASWEED